MVKGKYCRMLWEMGITVVNGGQVLKRTKMCTVRSMQVTERQAKSQIQETKRPRSSVGYYFGKIHSVLDRPIC
jgi:hypothetical protein